MKYDADPVLNDIEAELDAIEERRKKLFHRIAAVRAEGGRRRRWLNSSIRARSELDAQTWAPLRLAARADEVLDGAEAAWLKAEDRVGAITTQLAAAQIILREGMRAAFAAAREHAGLAPKIERHLQRVCKSAEEVMKAYWLEKAVSGYASRQDARVPIKDRAMSAPRSVPRPSIPAGAIHSAPWTDDEAQRLMNSLDRLEELNTTVATRQKPEEPADIAGVLPGGAVVVMGDLAGAYRLGKVDRTWEPQARSWQTGLTYDILLARIIGAKGLDAEAISAVITDVDRALGRKGEASLHELLVADLEKANVLETRTTPTFGKRWYATPRARSVFALVIAEAWAKALGK